MAGGYKQITGEDGVRFTAGNKKAEKWTEEAALLFGNDLLNWMRAEDENIFFDDFIYLQDHTGKYPGEVYADLPAYLAKKYLSFFDLLEKCRIIEKTKLKKFSAFDKLNASIAKFLLSAEYGLKEKSDVTTNNESINTDPLNTLKEYVALNRKARESD